MSCEDLSEGLVWDSVYFQVQLFLLFLNDTLTTLFLNVFLEVLLGDIRYWPKKRAFTISLKAFRLH